MRSTLRSLLVVSLLAAPLCGQAQVVRGVITDAANGPVSGAVVQLIDSAGAIVARQLSAERGTFRLTAARPGTYRVQTLRIGYVPTSSALFVLVAGADLTRNVVLSSIRVALDTLRVTERTSCRVARDVAASTLAVWEQVRTALTATQLSLGDSSRTATTVSFEKRIDPRDGKVRAQSSSTATGPAMQPWVSASVADVRRNGYVHSDSTGTAYDAPGLDLLLADSFLEDHCVHVVTEPRFGIAFEPTRDRDKVPEIKGTLWLDKSNLELRELEFRYANLPAEHDSAMGRMKFVRLSNGAWMISQWSIRMPVLEQKTTRTGFGRYQFTNMQVSVGDLVEQGGILSVFRRGTDTLWRHEPVTLTGLVRDSSGRRSAAGAYLTISKPMRAAVADSSGRFVITDLLPGEYVVEVNSALNDDIGAYRVRVPLLGSDFVDIRVPSAVTLAAMRPVPRVARFVGSVLADSTRRPVDGAVVTLVDASLSTTADTRGAFELTDVPPGTHTLSVRKIGYRMLDTSIAFRSGTTFSANLYLSQIPTLDSVHVVERAVLPSFEEHRKAGFGHFMTREDMAKVEGVSMSAIISTIPGAAVLRGTSTHAWATLNRGTRSIAGNDVPIIDRDDRALGAKQGVCYMAVYLDRAIVYSGRDREPLFDVSTISPDRIEAIEVYSGPSQIPVEYQGLHTSCGLMVIWTRRTFNDSTTEKP